MRRKQFKKIKTTTWDITMMKNDTAFRILLITIIIIYTLIISALLLPISSGTHAL